MERSDILQVLQDEVCAAKRNFEQAGNQFNAVMRDTPSGLPVSDGAQRIQNASKILSCAGQQLADAHVRLHDFVVFGIIPDRLQEV